MGGGPGRAAGLPVCTCWEPLQRGSAAPLRSCRLQMPMKSKTESSEGKQLFLMLGLIFPDIS